MDLCTFLHQANTIAVVGISSNPSRDSGSIARMLKDSGYTVYGVHPNEKEVFGIPVVPAVRDLQSPIDILDMFVKGELITPMISEIVALKPACVWFQFGVENKEAEEVFSENGIMVVKGKCLGVEVRRCGVQK
mgnify:CR=1